MPEYAEPTGSQPRPKRLIVGMSGASGAQLGIQLLTAMHQFPGWETHLIISKGAERTIAEETDQRLEAVKDLATNVYPVEDIGAAIASGTFKSEGMVIIPCSMKTLAGIATGFSHNLLIRAADVSIKERRKLVLVTRESPLSPIHLQNMLALANLGVTILPPVLTFYNHPVAIQDMVTHIVGKVLDIYQLDLQAFRRWGEEKSADMTQKNG